MIYNGDGDSADDTLANSLLGALNNATIAAIYRLADIIANGRPDEAIGAADTIFGFTLALSERGDDE